MAAWALLAHSQKYTGRWLDMHRKELPICSPLNEEGESLTKVADLARIKADEKGGGLCE